MTEKPLNFNAVIQGRAAEMIISKMSDYPKQHNGTTIGKSRATEILLCELWNLKHSTEIKPCE